MGDLGSLSYVQTDAAGGLEALDDMTPSAYEEVSDGVVTAASHTRLQNSEQLLDLHTLTQLVELQLVYLTVMVVLLLQ